MLQSTKPDSNSQTDERLLIGRAGPHESRCDQRLEVPTTQTSRTVLHGLERDLKSAALLHLKHRIVDRTGLPGRYSGIAWNAGIL